VIAVFVALGAAVGAPLRYLIDRTVQAKHDSVFPWGTFAVNLAGSLILGALIGAASQAHVAAEVSALIGTGLCGTLTTYSTFGFETVRLLEQRARFYAVVNVTASIVGGLGAGYVGLAVAQAIWR
jgi:fluoride exporter